MGWCYDIMHEADTPTITQEQGSVGGRGRCGKVAVIMVLCARMTSLTRIGDIL